MYQCQKYSKNPQRRIGMVWAFITCIEKKIAHWEGHYLLTDADRRSTLKMPEKLIEIRE